MTKKKLVLVNPVNCVRSGFSVNPSSRFPPLGLGILASLTPDTWDVKLLDENFSPFEYHDADLVGVTAFTSAANRAYEIASTYRKRGVPVVMGGIHASMCPTEALQFADAVVVGEAESVWAKVLADAESGKLTGLYHGEWLAPNRLAPPRRDVYEGDYVFASVQTSRGCPLDCEFCSVTAYNGRRYRRRPIEDVLDELESVPDELLFFVDDNIIGNGGACRAQALELFKGMVARDLKMSWFCQASINVADDPEVLDWAARAGCRMIFIGIEAEDDDALAEVNKRLNLKKGAGSYTQMFDRVHAAGIAVLGAFIFGMDSDTPETLRRRAEFMVNSDVDAMQLTTMTPLPGTRLFERLEKEGRLLYTQFPADWAHYDLTKLVHQPKSMEPDELWDVIRDCTEQVYALPTLKTKARRTLETTGSIETTEFAYRTNMNYRNIGLALGTLTE
ncbi:B12-binding domain-containing radical SAM protein [Aporhodopirellula aestuarii]|uniref:B12-binding domain-containing radical SAM protein n=1 Tax=Aporhodopirellula aestuarii TaxID=2950107 RepID=A0ABT0U216_9BACT|nr:radical SAM protein [Aporhodopirellula aestuarii]MCM2370631.1 B12-binding domain-containing radical SAM protein [Aporhodopirellula aestuarii]